MIDNVGDGFSGFLLISTRILLDLLSLVVQKHTLGEVKKRLNGHLMANCVGNIRTKNYENLIIIGFQVTVENVGDAFLGHSVVRCCSAF